ncbi:MAG: hypothetical protein AAB426_09090 [Myxococcota bacterium]
MNEQRFFDSASGPDLRSTMIAYIREHFGDLLGEHVALLDEPYGLDAIAELMRSGALDARR